MQLWKLVCSLSPTQLMVFAFKPTSWNIMSVKTYFWLYIYCLLLFLDCVSISSQWMTIPRRCLMGREVVCRKTGCQLRLHFSALYFQQWQQLCCSLKCDHWPFLIFRSSFSCSISTWPPCGFVIKWNWNLWSRLWLPSQFYWHVQFLIASTSGGGIGLGQVRLGWLQFGTIRFSFSLSCHLWFWPLACFVSSVHFAAVWSLSKILSAQISWLTIALCC